jgi:hypothetical protein
LINNNIIASLVTIIALTLASIGCATAPDITENTTSKADKKNHQSSYDAEKHLAETEKSNARAAMDAVVNSDAGKYAAADMDAAKKIWNSAEALMKEEKFIEAKQSYVAAKTAFKRAADTVNERRKLAAESANAAVADLEKAWDKLIATANSVRNRMKDKEMRNDWSAITKTFAEDVKATKEKIATDPAGARANIDELMSIIERWDTAFKELSPPLKPKAIKPEANPSVTLKK